MSQSSGSGRRADTGASGDCDKDAIRNGIDTDDDNDLLLDTIETRDRNRRLRDGHRREMPSATTTSTRSPTNYNGGPVLPYPSACVRIPNPLVNDDGSIDFDDDRHDHAARSTRPGSTPA